MSVERLFERSIAFAHSRKRSFPGRGTMTVIRLRGTTLTCARPRATKSAAHSSGLRSTTPVPQTHSKLRRDMTAVRKTRMWPGLSS